MRYNVIKTTQDPIYFTLESIIEKLQDDSNPTFNPTLESIGENVIKTIKDLIKRFMELIKSGIKRFSNYIGSRDRSVQRTIDKLNETAELMEEVGMRGLTPTQVMNLGEEVQKLDSLRRISEFVTPGPSGSAELGLLLDGLGRFYQNFTGDKQSSIRASTAVVERYIELMEAGKFSELDRCADDFIEKFDNASLGKNFNFRGLDGLIEVSVENGAGEERTFPKVRVTFNRRDGGELRHLGIPSVAALKVYNTALEHSKILGLDERDLRLNQQKMEQLFEDKDGKQARFVRDAMATLRSMVASLLSYYEAVAKIDHFLLMVGNIATAYVFDVTYIYKKTEYVKRYG